MPLAIVARLAYALFALAVLGVTLIHTAITAAAPAASAPTAAPILIADFAFKPATVTVAVGATVRWTNKDEVAHTATATIKSPAKFESGNLDQNQSFTFTFTKAGKYTYVCTYHPTMTGNVVVVATPSPVSLSRI